MQRLADAEDAKSWPFQEARALLKRVADKPEDEPVVFETGYGPSGLPHMGTFGEVARTTMVRRAFEALTGRPTRLICFSDDMDGMRKVPDTVPKSAKLDAHLGKPLTAVPDPWGEGDSFAAANNARLRRFLDSFGFDYEFQSATTCYTSGRFDEKLLKALEAYDKIMEIILPTLGAERQQTYSPFLPVSPTTGRVLQVPTLERNVRRGTIVFEDEDGERKETPVTGGHVKMQWKADWALRWAALGVDYEMCGEDLTESVKHSSKIVRALGAVAPVGFQYQLFLDDQGQKISKSKGNGLTLEEWLTYGPQESLALFMFHRPKQAKKLYVHVIPKTVDEYLSHLSAYQSQEGAKRLDNPVWHIHEGQPPETGSPVSFGVLLNLAAAANAQDRETLWGFLRQYAPEASPQSHPLLDRLVDHALAFDRDFARAERQTRKPSEQERAGLVDLLQRLETLDEDERDAETIQTEVFAAGKAQGFDPLRLWFQGLYETLLGTSSGPRFGSFAAVYGLDGVKRLIRGALERKAA